MSISVQGHLVTSFRRWSVIEIPMGDYIREVVVDTAELKSKSAHTNELALEPDAEVAAVLPIVLVPEIRPKKKVEIPAEFVTRVREHPSFEE